MRIKIIFFQQLIFEVRATGQITIQPEFICGCAATKHTENDYIDAENTVGNIKILPRNFNGCLEKRDVAFKVREQEN